MGKTWHRCLKFPAWSCFEDFSPYACFGSYFAASNGYSTLRYALAASIVSLSLTSRRSVIASNLNSNGAVTTVAAS